VDDNTMNQSLMKHMLGQWNVDFEIVSNGQEAVDYLKNKHSDLILMDLQMPQLDGYAATQHIRDVLQLDIPIIAMTAHALAGEREKCLSRGMNEYLSKPINQEELFKLISHFGIGFQSTAQIEENSDKEEFIFLDLAYMRLVSRGDRTFERTVTRQFIDKIPGQVQQLQIAYANNDFSKFKLRAHDFKTSVAIMGLLPVLDDELDALEFMTEQNTVSEEILSKVAHILDTAVKEAEQLLSTYDT